MNGDMGGGVIETSVSFVPQGAGGNRWAGHKVGLTLPAVESRLDTPALEKFQGLSLIQQIFIVRAVEEIALCKFRETRHDPDYRIEEMVAWKQVLTRLIGDEGTVRLGV